MIPANTVDAVRKHLAKALHRLALPAAHLVRMHFVLGCDLLDRLVAPQRFQRYAALKSAVNRRRFVISYPSVIRWNTP